jgi:hypothetical protein
MEIGNNYASYGMNNAIDPTRPFTIDVRVRVLQSVQIQSGAPATAFIAAAFTGAELFGIGLNTTTLCAPFGTREYHSIDATQFHDYRIEAVPGVSVSIFVDGALVVSESPPQNDDPNELILGNASSFEHGLAEVTSYSVAQGPTLAPIADQNVNEGSLLTVPVTATDPDPSAVLTYSLDTAPAGAVIDPSTGVFTFTPDDGPASYAVTVRATDNGTPSLNDTQTFTINVNNVAPTVNPLPPATVCQGDTYTAAGSFTDPGADTWSATVNYGDGSGDQALALNADKTFNLSHTYTATGSYPVTVTVSDDDGGSGSATATVTVQPTLSINDVTVTEGDTGSVNATFTIRLSAAYTQPVVVHYSTANGTAVAGKDYAARSGNLRFNAGQVSKQINVPVLGDLLNEDTENFFVNLSGATNACVADSQGIGTILDNDPLPSVSINDVSVVEGNGGTTKAIFTVSLSAASGRTITVQYATANGTAEAPSDYVFTSAVLTFNPGQTSKPVTVLVKGDTIPEPDEIFYVNLLTVTNVTIADGQGIGTIINDDGGPGAPCGMTPVGEQRQPTGTLVELRGVKPVGLWPSAAVDAGPAGSGQTVTTAEAGALERQGRDAFFQSPAAAEGTSASVLLDKALAERRWDPAYLAAVAASFTEDRGEQAGW